MNQPELPPVSGFDLFPDMDKDMDRRIAHSETRIKYWVIAGVVANLVALGGIGAPVIFSFAAMQAQSRTTYETVQTINSKITDVETRLQRQEVQQQMLELWAQDRGYKTPNFK